MATLDDLKNRIIFMLGDDPNESTDLSDELLLDAVHSALDAVLPQCWKPATYALPGSSTLIALPTDLYEVQAVFDSSLGMYLSPALLAPGQPDANSAGNAWLEYPYGYLTLYSQLSSGGILYYAAQWAKPQNGTDTLETPDYATTALTLYGASYAIIKTLASASKLGNFKTRLDSGDPVDQPLLQFSTYLLKRFEIEMSRMPKQARGQK